jgi:tetratricopeptide (TPR) repeat protein
LSFFLRNILVCAFLLQGSYALCAQEDVVSTEEMLVEQQNINFQTFFFEALAQKAIGNYDKAIYALEACHDIDKKDRAVLFELSKNYGFQFKYTEAEYYARMALELEPENMYMLRHLKEIKTKQNDFEGAIGVQNRIIALNPEEEADLVILYIKSGEIDQAVSLLTKLDAENKVPEGLIALKESLLQQGEAGSMSSTPSLNPSESVDPNEEIDSQLMAGPTSKSETLLETFERDRSYKNLVPLLERELKTKQFLDLLKHSEEGLSLFPAQPFVYLMKGTALIQLRKNREAAETLQEGLDYLIDDPEMEYRFLEQLSVAFKAMGENKKATDYFNKAQEIKEES